jgi:RimJ/RimL family protein N-acetyltransferase
VNIHGKHVVLRALERADMPLLHEWANNPEVQRLLGGWHFPTSLKDQDEWYSALSCASLDQRFAIDVKDVGLIGTANLVAIDWKNRNAFHGMMLGNAQNRGKGYGADTIMAIMRYAFSELGLQRLDTDIIEYNEASLRTYIGKCGWMEEGRRAKWYFRQGRYWDKVIVGITRDRYFQTVESTGYWG